MARSPSKLMAAAPIPGHSIESRILIVRGHRVMLDSDLAKLYGVEVRTLNQAVKRNHERFPTDFMFQLAWEEVERSRSQSVILNDVAMLSSVLQSKRAVQVNVEIMRAFVRLRNMIGHNRELARRLDALESKYDRQFKVVFDAIRELMAPPPSPKRRIGFVSD